MLIYCRNARIISCLLALLFCYMQASSQKNSLKGIVTDTTEKKGLQYSIVALINLADTTLYRSVRTNEAGEFEITKIPSGKYNIMISYPGMADYLQDMMITDTSKINLKKVSMIPESVLMQEVIVKSGLAIRMRGDTLEYSADSFAVKPGSNVEELLKRLPGIQVDKKGKITAQGKEVKKVLVDGDEFFSDDPGLATKYLSADAIDKVQVFEKKSEQSEFSGIDDGNTTKTINLKLKKNKKNGYFGKLSAGSNGDQFYNHEAMAALFNGTKKISLYGLSSKTGRAGLSYSEMSNYVAQDYEVINDGSGIMMYSTNDDYESENYYGNGLPSIMSGGFHYSDKWKGGKQKLFTNYRIKQTKAYGWSNGNSVTVLPDGTGFANKYSSVENSKSFSQKANGSFLFPVDSFSTIKVSVNGNIGNSQNNSNNISETKNEKGFLVNNSRQAYDRLSDSRKFASNITYQHSFRKVGRTLSVLLQQSNDNVNKNNFNYSETNLFDPSSGVFKSADTLDQLQKSIDNVSTYAAKATFTEKLSKMLALSVEYGWKTGLSSNVFNTLNKVDKNFTDRVDSLSSDYDFRVSTNITGTNFSFNNKKIGAVIGAKAYFTKLSQLDNDSKFNMKRDFVNFAPNATFTYRFKQYSSVSLSYSGQTFQPSLEQIQPLRKSSNQLYTQIGNPDLKPGFRHSASFNLNSFNLMSGASLYAFFNFGYAERNITTAMNTDAQGRTISQYINSRGLPSFSGQTGYNWKFKKFKLKPSVSANFSKNSYLSVMNGEEVINENIYSGINTSFNYEWPDIITLGLTNSLSYNSGWSNVKNYKTTSNFSHSHTVSATAYLPKKFEINTDCEFMFQPKNSSFNNNLNTIQWDISIEKKVLKKDKGIIKIAAFDLLNQNMGYQRSVSGNIVSESNSLVIKRYFLLSLIWKFSKSL